MNRPLPEKGLNPSGLCMCGCGERTSTAPRTNTFNKTIKGQPMRFIRGHQCRKSPNAYLIDPNTGCWVWQRCKSRGYGQTSFNNKSCAAHRVAYERLVGPIPEGMWIDHLCRNRACVNPDHLEPVTPAENVRRGNVPKLTKKAVRVIREGGEAPYVLAQRYGVSEITVRQARSGLTWADA